MTVSISSLVCSGHDLHARKGTAYSLHLVKARQFGRLAYVGCLCARDIVNLRFFDGVSSKTETVPPRVPHRAFITMPSILLCRRIAVERSRGEGLKHNHLASRDRFQGCCRSCTSVACSRG